MQTIQYRILVLSFALNVWKYPQERERQHIKELALAPHRKQKNSRKRRIAAWMNVLERKCGRASSL